MNPNGAANYNLVGFPHGMILQLSYLLHVSWSSAGTLQLSSIIIAGFNVQFLSSRANSLIYGHVKVAF
jgi:hypothetical protein